MSRRLFYCDQHEIPLPEGHRFPANKYRLLRDMLAFDRYFSFVPADPADRALVEAVHDPAYVASIFDGTADAAVMRRIGFPWSPQLVTRTLCSVGGTLQATREALNTGWGGNLAGGTHHALRETGAGFCVFNDIAIAIQWARKYGWIGRAAVIDLDVHQGDGTAALFTGDLDVFTASIHCASNFPFRKQQSSLDVELPEGTVDSEFLTALDGVLEKALASKPDIIYFQSGVDGLATDALGKFAVTPAGMRERDRRVLAAAHDRRIPLVVTLGGGYSKPIERTLEAHASTFRTAAEIFDGASFCSRLPE